MKKGKIYGIGLGPGDPELITLKSANIIKSSHYIFFFKKKNSDSRALNIVEDIIRNDAYKIALEFPVTTEIDYKKKEYKDALKKFYEECVVKMDNILEKSINICLLCEGDPFFYGSFIHIFERLKERFEIEIIPGVTGMSGAWSATRIPMVSGNEIMTILMGTLNEKKLKSQIKKSDVLVIMKIGKNFKKIFRVFKDENLLDKAYLISDATTRKEKIYKLNEIDVKTVPYFSIILLKKTIEVI
tara:strand:+ start:8380 stop:9108 length:729 start_codon:yes stop_codon:yes gene_type:complete